MLPVFRENESAISHGGGTKMAIESINNAQTSYSGGTSQAADTQYVDARTQSAVEAQSKEQSDSGTAPSANEAEKKKEANSVAQNVAVQTEQIKKAVEDMKKRNPNTEAIFGIHEGTNRVTIKIIDKDSKKVLREYPPEQTLDMIEKVWEMAGLMVDEKR